MTPALRLLWALRDVGVRLWAEGGVLHYDAPPRTITDEIRRRIPEARPDLLRLLSEPCPCSACTAPGAEPHGPRCYCPACLDADPKWEAWRAEIAEEDRREAEERTAIQKEGRS
jgi:hypothetical protein